MKIRAHGGRAAEVALALFLPLAVAAYLPPALDKTQIKWAACFLAAGLGALALPPLAPRGGFRLPHLFALLWLLLAAASLARARTLPLAAGRLACEGGLVLSFVVLSSAPPALVPAGVAAFVAAAAVSAAAGLLQAALGVVPQGLTQHPNIWGGVCAAALPAALGLCLFGLRAGRRWFPWAGVACALLLAGLFVSRSRGAWLGLLAGASALWPLLARVEGRPAWRRGLLWAAAFALVAAGIALAFRESLLSDIRLPIWRSTARVVARAPLGVGLGNFLSAVAPLRTEAYHLHPRSAPLLLHPHSEALRVLAETGWFGLLAWLGVFLSILLAPPRLREGPWAALAAGVLGALLVLLVHGQVSVVLWHPTGALLLWGLAGAAMALGRGEASPGGGRAPGLSPALLRTAGAGLLVLALLFAAFPVRSSLLAGRALRARAREDWQAAAVLYGRAWAADPTNLEAARRFGYALIRAGRPEDAATAYETLLQVAPDYGTVHGELGRLLFLLGRPDEARVHLERQLGLTPLEWGYRELLERLAPEGGSAGGKGGGG